MRPWLGIRNVIFPGGIRISYERFINKTTCPHYPLHDKDAIEMNDLDEKLKSIVGEVSFTKADGSESHITEAVEKLKQAFTEAGYTKSIGKLVEDDVRQAFQLLRDGAIKMMTGQEWYDRFEKELFVNIPTIEPTVIAAEFVSRAEVLRAAKRAANITKEENETT